MPSCAHSAHLLVPRQLLVEGQIVSHLPADARWAPGVVWPDDTRFACSDQPGSGGPAREYNVLMNTEPKSPSAAEPVPAGWLAEFEAAARRPLEQRFRYSFIKTYKPVLDDATFRAFDTNGRLPAVVRREPAGLAGLWPRFE